MNLKQLILTVFEDSPYRKAAVAAGFKFGAVDVIEDFFDHSIVVRGTFDCVCGNIETYNVAISLALLRLNHIPNEAIDPAFFLHRNGSFSRSHLVKDGYSAEEVDRISSIYRKHLEQGLCLHDNNRSS